MPGRQRNNDTGHFPEPRGAHAKTRRLSSSPVEFPWELPSEPSLFGVRPSRQPPSHGSLTQRRHLLVSADLQQPGSPGGNASGPQTDTRVQTRVRTQSHSFTFTNKNNFRRRNKGI